jgi:fumarate reductase subunit C
MSKMNYKKYNEAEREYWAQAKAQGKRQFILREIVFNIILWLAITVAIGFTDRSGSASVWSVAFTAIVLLPICLLGGYLSGRWKWSDFEKKYPE